MSCYGRYPIIFKVLYMLHIPAGGCLGFLPSAVFFLQQLNNMLHMTSDVEVTVGLFPAKHEPLTSSLAGELVAG